MKKYSYTLETTASSQQEADIKMKSIAIIASKLTTKELAKLSDIIKNDPAKTAMAKKALGV